MGVHNWTSTCSKYGLNSWTHGTLQFFRTYVHTLDLSECSLSVKYADESNKGCLWCVQVEMSSAWGVESMSLPLCQIVRNPAPGNFRMSLCFGRLSSSSSPVILWSYQTSCSLPYSLSTLIGLMWEIYTYRTLPGERQRYPTPTSPFPPTGQFLLSPPIPFPSRPSLRWQEVWKHSSFFSDTRRPILVSLRAPSAASF